MIFTGYGAVFFDPRDPGTEYRMSPSVRERIAPTAFDKTLASGEDVTCCINHDMNFSLGRRSKGTLRISKDARGLKYEADFDPEDPDHAKLLVKQKRGDFCGASFTFRARETEVIRDGGDVIRVIHDCRLYELGPVLSPAYNSTTSGVRSNAARGSVRWCMENPDAAKVYQRLQQLEEMERQQVKRRQQQIESFFVRERLFELENT